MSDTPIFDRLSAERNYKRMLDSRASQRALYGPVKPYLPDEYLDGPLHMIGAQTFDDGEVLISPWVKQGMIAGLKGTPFDPDCSKFVSGSSLPDLRIERDLEAEAKIPHKEPQRVRLWSSVEQAEYSAEFEETFQKYVSDVRQMIQKEESQGAVITSSGIEMHEDGSASFVIQGTKPTYKPLFETEEAPEE